MLSESVMVVIGYRSGCMYPPLESYALLSIRISTPGALLSKGRVPMPQLSSKRICIDFRKYRSLTGAKECWRLRRS
jgi:hypothetical protein